MHFMAVFFVVKEDLATFSSTSGECDGGILHSYMLRNEAASKKECRELLQSLKQSLLTPLLNSPSSQNDFSTIDEVQKEIHGNFHESAKGPAKHHVYQEFMKVRVQITRMILYWVNSLCVVECNRENSQKNLGQVGV